MLDSVHFRPLLPPRPAPPPSGGRLFDAHAVGARLAAGGPREARENTYSVPLATHRLREGVDDRRRQAIRDFPRLQFGGAHLKDPTPSGRATSAARRSPGSSAARSPRPRCGLLVAALRARSGTIGMRRVAARDLAAEPPKSRGARCC